MFKLFNSKLLGLLSYVKLTSVAIGTTTLMGSPDSSIDLAVTAPEHIYLTVTLPLASIDTFEISRLNAGH